MFDLLTKVAFAEGEQAVQNAEMNTASGIMSIMPLILMIIIFYFILIRPQKKQEKKQKAMLAALQIGDKVISIGGICGKITKLKDDAVYLETGFVGNPNEKSVIKIERSAIKTVLTIHDDE